jgi:hypothetical protein
MLRLMGGGNHALHYESICLGLPVGTPARVCLSVMKSRLHPGVGDAVESTKWPDRNECGTFRPRLQRSRQFEGSFSDAALCTACTTHPEP